MRYELIPRWWKYGRPADLWIQHLDLVREFVAEKNLKPLPSEVVPYNLPMGERVTERKWWPVPFPGGMRIAHLHLGDDIYVLGREQWGEFSNRVLDDFRTKLDAVRSVKFEEVLEISEALGGM